MPPGTLDVFPAIDVAVGIRVALYAEHEVCLQIWQDCQIARIQGAALETVVDTDHQLIHIFHLVDSLIHADGILWIFVKTGRQREGQDTRQDVCLYISDIHFIFSFLA